jgi:hypothetical protein
MKDFFSLYEKTKAKDRLLDFVQARLDKIRGKVDAGHRRPRAPISLACVPVRALASGGGVYLGRGIKLPYGAGGRTIGT